MTAEQIADITVEEETIQDAISAGKVLASTAGVDASHVVLLGHSMGAMLAPRIASEAKGVFSAMILVAGTPLSLLDLIVAQNDAVLATLEGATLAAAPEQVNALKEQVKALKRIKKADSAKKTTIVGVNGYYFWEMMQPDAVKLIKKLKLPTYIVQGNLDFQVTMDNGIDAYEDEIESKYSFVSYKLFRNLNHLLMLYEGPAEAKGTVAEYDTPATVDTQAGRNLADWVLDLGKTDEEEKPIWKYEEPPFAPSGAENRSPSPATGR
jgi:pimeloyl-ACP methyl ester carboxylesterase